MPVHTGILTRKNMQTHGHICTLYVLKHIWEHREGKYKGRHKWASFFFFLLFLPLSIFFSNTPVPFNLTFILPHSQYHLQSVSTLQHFHCVSHLSLSQLLTLLFPSSDTEWSRKQSLGLDIKVSERARDLISNISYSHSPHRREQEIFLAYTVAFYVHVWDRVCICLCSTM